MGKAFMSEKTPSHWDYTNCEPGRLALLLEPTTFPQIVDKLVAHMRVLCHHFESRDDDQSFKRVIYNVNIDIALFDAFFNSASGYRGCYFRSASSGIEANILLLTKISPALISWSEDQNDNFDLAWADKSLQKPTAKAWLAETSSSGFCDKCPGEWSASYPSDVEIRNGRWEFEDGIEASWGRQAPSLRRIRVFGGFLNQLNQPWISDHKLNRAQHINQRGWS